MITYQILDLEKANYKLHGRMDFQGLNISVENRKGSVRSGMDKDGHKWSTKMVDSYGRIIGIPRKGSDGEHVDVFVGPDKTSQKVFIIHINHADTGKFDEDKCFLGFSNKDAAMASFQAHYDKAGQKLFGGITEMDMSNFKRRLEVQSEGVIKSFHIIDLQKGWTHGYIREDKKTGKRFQVSSYKNSRPESKEEIEKKKVAREKRDQERMEGPQERLVYTISKEAFDKVLKHLGGDREKAIDFSLKMFSAGFSYDERRATIKKYAPYFYPDLSKKEAEAKALQRARELRVLAKSLSGSELLDTLGSEETLQFLAGILDVPLLPSLVV